MYMTVYDRIFGDFPAKNTVYIHRIYGSDQPYIWAIEEDGNTPWASHRPACRLTVPLTSGFDNNILLGARQSSS